MTDSDVRREVIESLFTEPTQTRKKIIIEERRTFTGKRTEIWTEELDA